jgi:hypothetical protein
MTGSLSEFAPVSAFGIAGQTEQFRLVGTNFVQVGKEMPRSEEASMALRMLP